MSPFYHIPFEFREKKKKKKKGEETQSAATSEEKEIVQGRRKNQKKVFWMDERIESQEREEDKRMKSRDTLECITLSLWIIEGISFKGELFRLFHKS